MTKAAVRLIRPDQAVRTISDAVENGSQRDLLVALRDHISMRIDDGVPARELASLARQLMILVRDIRSIDDDTAAEARSSRRPSRRPFDPDAI